MLFKERVVSDDTRVYIGVSSTYTSGRALPERTKEARVFFSGPGFFVGNFSGQLFAAE
jgi:hypothetical protein